MLQRYCLGLTLLLGVAHLPAAAQVKMEWKFQPGDTFNIETVSTSKQTMTTQGKDVRQDITTTTVIGFKVKEKTADGNVVIEQKIENMKVTNKTNPPDQKFIDQIKGATWTITVNPQLEVVKIDGIEELIRKIAGDEKEVFALVSAALTPENLKKSAHEVFAFLPGKPVKPGDKWTGKLNEPLGPLGSLTRSTQYTYEGPGTVDGKQVEKISFTATATYSPPKEKTGAGLHITGGDLKTDKLAGTIYFNPGTGRLVQSEAKMTLKGHLSMSIGTITADTQVEQELNTKTRVTDVKP